MALKTESKTEPKTEAQPPVQTTILELALYKQYTWLGETYEKGKPYRFKNADAMALLAEQDAGRPVWKLYQAPKPKQAPMNEVVDATSVQAGERADITPGKRIEIGSDTEIQDILGAGGAGDVTV